MSGEDTSSLVDLAPIVSATDLKTAARRLARDALATLQAIMKGQGQDSVRLAAAREVLDRGFGSTAARRPAPSRAAKATAPKAAPYTVVVQRLGDPREPDLEPFD